VKLLLDTDCDLGDVDDALCLDYLLRQPACELLGITTVAGDTVHQARVASMLCRAAGVEVPIRPGAPAPLLAPALPAKLEPQLPSLARLRTAEEAVLGRWPHQQSFPEGEAVELLRTTIRAHPGEVTLLAVAPLTNLALLFAADPGVVDLLGGLVLMGGCFASDSGPEWNASYDPQATAMVYRAPVGVHRSVGFEITERTGLSADELATRVGVGGGPLAELLDAWFAERDGVWFHDPLTAATLFHDDLCRFERGTVEPSPEGLTRFTPGPDGPHEIATSVDVAAFFEAFVSG
jgi:purine nucleosidase